jgi:hypothetical protein
MATIVPFDGLNYSIPAANEEGWQSLSAYLIALAKAIPSGSSVNHRIRVSTLATTAIATSDYAVMINSAGAATVNLPAGVEGQIFYIGDASGLAGTNNITINRNGANTILGGTSVILDSDGETLGIQFSAGNWYRLAQSFPTSVTGPTSAVDNGVALFDGITGQKIKDLGVGTVGQVLLTDGITPSFGLIENANISASAAIAHSKLAAMSSATVLLGNGSNVPTATAITGDVTINSTGVTAISADVIVNADINAGAAIAFSKLATLSPGFVLLGNGSNQVTGMQITGDITLSDAGVAEIASGVIVNADINASAAIAYSKIALTGAVVNADISASAAIEYSKLALTGTIANADISLFAEIAFNKMQFITPGTIIVGGSFGTPTATAMTGDISIDSAGVTSIATGVIVDADINASAAIAYSKLNLANSVVNADINASAAIARSKIASGTADHIIVNDGSGNLSSVASLDIARGGTGLTALGSALQLLRVNAGATGLEFATISGVGDVSGPASSVTNGITAFASTTGKALKDLGVGTANQVLLTDGTTPAFGAITNAFIDASAAIAYSKLNLTGSIVNADVNASAAIDYSKLALTGSILNADVNASAAIAYSKLATTTASRAIVSDGSGFLAASTTTAIEVSHLAGVTSAIQTQINAKANTTDVVLLAGAQTVTGVKTFSSTIVGSISGNAGTVTNGVYDTGTQAIGGLKTFSQLLTAEAGIDVKFGGTSLRIGADLDATTRTNATRKYAYLQVPNYTNAEEDVLLAQMETDTAFNVIRYGGGDAARNAATEHRFFTAANATTLSGTERMRIDSAGNVGIGTASPAEQLHIESTFPAILLKDTNGTANSRTTRIATSGANFVIQGLNDALSSTVDILSANNSTGAVTIGSSTAGAHTLKASASYVALVQNDLNSLRADGIGVFLANSNAGGGTLGSTAFFRGFNSAAGTTKNLNERVVIRTDGNIYNITGAIGSISDASVKTNITDARSYMSDLCRLRVVKYERIDNLGVSQLGLIAQEVEAVFPSLVESGDGGPKGIKTSILNPMMLKAIQELNAKVESLSQALQSKTAKAKK